jgi:hypothetical protein
VQAFELRPYDTIDGRPHAVGDGRVYVLADEGRVPVRLDGWFRFAAWLDIGGVAAELVQWERGRSGWPAVRAPAWEPPPVAPSSVEGRPRWDPPAAVAAARARTGVEPHDRDLALP